MHEQVKHPCVQHKLAVIRNQDTGHKKFRELATEITMFLCYEALKNVSLKKVDVQTLLDELNSQNAPYVTELALFDVYRGQGVKEGEKSLAFRVLLKDTQKTLTDSEIEPSIAMLVGALHKIGAKLRGK